MDEVQFLNAIGAAMRLPEDTPVNEVIKGALRANQHKIIHLGEKLGRQAEAQAAVDHLERILSLK